MIRTIQLSDCEAIAAIEAQTFSTAFDRGCLLTFLKMPVFCGFVDDLYDPNNPGRPDNLAGYLLATMVFDEAEILSIAVDANYQKCGRASGLLGYFLSHVAAQDVKTVLLEVAADNTPALTLYHRHGFAEFGRRTAYYKRSRGHGNAIMMRRQCN